MKKIIFLLAIGLTGCTTNLDKSAYWHSVGQTRSLICKERDTAVDMIKFASTENSGVGQALKYRKMNKSNQCFIVESIEVSRSGKTFLFPLTDEFPESFRGVKKEIQEIDYKHEKYWLIDTRN